MFCFCLLFGVVVCVVFWGVVCCGVFLFCCGVWCGVLCVVLVVCVCSSAAYGVGLVVCDMLTE